MNNPFTSNHQNYLFRKNYQSIAKTNQPKPIQPSNDYSSNKLSMLQSNNPFKNQTTTPRAFSNSISASRVLSASRVGMTNNGQSRALLGKPKLLEEDYKWKRQIEQGQRQRFQYYGAQGLRYNAQTHNFNPTYKSQQKWRSPNDHNNYKYEINNKNPYPERNPSRAEFQQSKNRQASQEYYKEREKPAESKRVNLKNNIISTYQDYYVVQQKPTHKLKKQTFQDQFQEDLINQIAGKNSRLQKQMKDDKNYLSTEKTQEQEQSKLMDMFGSSYDYRFRQQMKENSLASPYDEKFKQSSNYNGYMSRPRPGLDMYDSNHDRLKDTLRGQRRNIPQGFYQSAVRPMLPPDKIEIHNITYHRIDI